MKKKDKQELSYYGLLLLSFLKESHPDKANDKDFILLRSELAAESYATAIADGYTQLSAEEIASSILYEGLLFSRYDTIRNVLINEFTIIPSERIDSLAMELLVPAEEVFSGYPTGDSFAASPEFTALYTELIGFIDLWREENEL
ncbi:hypothetical protein M2137_001850 [Parabacteroides sp. PFB2-10]|uniref:DUF1896 family protein n=1 Tax=Parabacteroides sp. PFB2-10 TaxID=1742405 RepID=UPI002473A37F|nr:DUF1896 family protein [Parabacteroides sp. PFB2-10]MDH6313063.1 hypothetical protein [Parabacteroides sp. PFB2-10]